MREDGGETTEPEIEDRAGSPGEVFRAFLVLGLTSFGGPVAHLGYFEREIVTKRRWISPGDYAETLAIAQLLPGPASSQVGMAIGIQRAGVAGSLAAWLGFTLPSAVLMFVFALVVGRSGDHHQRRLVARTQDRGRGDRRTGGLEHGQESRARSDPRDVHDRDRCDPVALVVAACAQLLGIAAGGVAGWLLFGRGNR